MRPAWLLGWLLLGTSGVAQADARRGMQAPDFSLPELHGGLLHLSELRGKVVVVDFWASWCEPCKKELPELSRLQQELGARGLQVITVNLDQERQNAINESQRLKLSLPIGLDPQGQVASIYDPPKMPTSYVLDRQGVVRFVHEGFDGARDLARLREELNSLAGPPRTAL